MRYRTLLLAACVVLLILPASTGQRAPASSGLVINNRADMIRAMDEIQGDLATLNSSHDSYRQAAEKLAGMHSDLNSKAQQVAKAANAVTAARSNPASNAALMQATQRMQETQMSFNLQYLQLQNQMQAADRQYAAVSNIMKTKHDTVKNSISNVR